MSDRQGARPKRRRSSSLSRKSRTVQKTKRRSSSSGEEGPVKKKPAKGKGSKRLLGGHMSIAGGIWKAVHDSVIVGGTAFAMFLGSQRTWKSKPIDERAAERFRQACVEYGFHPSVILPHGSYLMNCGSPRRDIFQKSRSMLIDELRRCEQLGLTMFNFHPGSTLNEISVEECLERIADSINYAHQHTNKVMTVIENMCCQGNTVGGRFSEIKGIIKLVRNKKRIGVCLDTCHAFAAGYDLSARGGVKKMLDEFDAQVGMKYLMAIHLNDSKGMLECHKDRHENIGYGHIGLDGFRQVMNEPRLRKIPMILETPHRPNFDYEKEIKLLRSLCN
ncbi:probable endonuclease 4 isoform X2 [Erpetoichthys calabaricus]|uniref:Si:ch211-141o9.10 n=1 Tax=Erpetoichthys calabaricus TaxID=27687 RepID=A0A8C4T2B2_ERPCA|nr:probable endonuclease 4 isoform X2 [Erpetoichthys calabaricus]